MLPPVFLVQAVGVVAPSAGGFVPAHTTRSYTQHLAASPQEVFSLLGPVGEKKWARGWEPRFAFPAGGGDEAGAVFTIAGHGPETLWVLNTFDEHRLYVEYLQFTPAVKVAVLRIALKPSGQADETLAEISYSWTALSQKGNEWVEAHVAHFEQGMADWEAELNGYLKASPRK
jgi:hypothetical protein